MSRHACSFCFFLHRPTEMILSTEFWFKAHFVRTRHAKRSLMLPYKLRTGWKFTLEFQSIVITDMSYVRRVLWYMQIYFFFFRRSFHDGPMSFEDVPGWILLKASLLGGSKTSISCCCAIRRGWRGRWTEEDAFDPSYKTHSVPFCKPMSGQAVFEFLFALPHWSDFVNWLLIPCTLCCSHEVCTAQSHVAVQAEEAGAMGMSWWFWNGAEVILKNQLSR